ncbi:MAG TPA: N-acetylmuramoyl-L-alanine amidase [bacterium]|nr:N-acetylmuramoyl-L-alanine amidase [bacterium]
MKRQVLVLLVFLTATAAAAGDIPWSSTDTGAIAERIPELSGFSVDGVAVDLPQRLLTVRLTLPASFTLNERLLDEMNRLLVGILAQRKIPFRTLVLLARRPDQTGWRDIRSLLPVLPPVPRKEHEPAASEPNPYLGFPRAGVTGTPGALTGKTVYLSAGHGWYYYADQDRWITQRGNTVGIVEDLSNTEIVSYYLAPMLRNAGAIVFTARESDRNALSVTVDDADATNLPANGAYEESAGWTESTGTGWGRLTTPLASGDAPFSAGHYRVTEPATGRWARWTPNLPTGGRYQVFVSFRPMSDRAPTARYEVRHAGGTTTVVVDQRHHGNTWFPLGEFPFLGGYSVDKGSVTLLADTTAGGSYVIADAVRFGGGTGVIDRDGGVSGRPRWEEAARYHAQLLGAPATVYDTSDTDNSDDVTTRSRWAAWENESGWDDSVFISWHSNAYNGNARGTSTYVYGYNDPGTGWEPAAQEGSEELATLLHNGVVAALRDGWDAAWPVSGSGLYSAWFGELNPSYNNEMPACLIELAFHDNTTDSNALRDPRFRLIAARAATQAVIQYFADRDTLETVYPPDTPLMVRTTAVGPHEAIISWDASPDSPRTLHGDAATGYLVQRSTDGVAFDDGVAVEGATSFTAQDLYPYSVGYFRVIAYNDGGRSFPSPVVAVRPKSDGAQVLIVDGFERLDRGLLVAQDLSSYGLDTVMRMFLERMNTFDYVRAHALALSELSYSFDSAQKSALAEVDLSAYDAVLWFAGEQSTTDMTITVDEQTRLCDYLDGGGILFISGSEYGWDLYHMGDATDQAFFTDCLGLSYLGDDAGIYQAATATGGEEVFNGSLSFDDGSFIYNADFPDLIEAAGNGVTFLGYGDGTGGGAGVVTGGDRKVAALGFPFETILDADTRRTLLAGILDWYGLTALEESVDEDTMDDDMTEVDEEEMVEEDTVVSDETPDQAEPTDQNDDIETDGIVIDETSDEDVIESDNEISDDHAAPVDDGYTGPDYGGGCAEGGDYSFSDDDISGDDDNNPGEDDTAKGSSSGCGCSLI